MPPKKRSRTVRTWLNDLSNKLSSPSKPDFTETPLMDYATYDARLASYAPPTKRSKAGWPHKSPSPHDLAKAGFYYKASSGKDNVQCFMCERQLDGWEEDDDPLQEHLKHGSDCAWALLMSIEQESAFDTSNMDDPTSSRIADARRITFETMAWPHENKRGWTCKTEKMVEGGWHFAPTAECEDYTSCVYCKLSLDGWEPKDNPFEEHYRRSPDCTFFVFAGTTAPSKRPKAKKGRASRTSKASRASTQSNATLMSQADESTGIIEILGEDSTLEHNVDNSVISIQSTTSTATNKGKRKAHARAKSAAPKKAKTTKGKKKQVEESEIEPELETQETQPEVEEVQEKPKAKRTRTKKKQPTPEPSPEPEIEPEPAAIEEEEEVIVIEEPRRKSSSRLPSIRNRLSTPQARPEPESDLSAQMKDLQHEVDMEDANTKPSDAFATPKSDEEEDEEPSYPVLPEETPTEDYQDAIEEPEPEAYPDAEDRELTPLGPPQHETTPIPAQQISPLKELSHPPRQSLALQKSETPKRRSRHSRVSRRSSNKQEEKQQTSSPSQPSDLENRPPSTLPQEKRPPMSSPGAPPPKWTPVDIETVFQTETVKEETLFGGAITGTLSEQERNMTVQQWIEHVAGQAETKLSAEGERVVSIFEREGRRAMAALESIQCI